MTTRMCYLVTAQDGRAQRWARWLRAEGWRVEQVATLDQFKPQPGTGPVQVALVDFAFARRRPAEAVSKLRAEASDWRFAFVAEPSDAFGAGLAQALGSGADDVFSDTLDARALINRLAALAEGVVTMLGLPDGRIRLDPVRRQAWAGVARPRLLRLTPTEFQLLSMLLAGKGRVVSRRELIDRAWPGEDVNLETVDRHIGSLRRKLGSFARRIRTAHGEGYAAV